MIAKRIQPITAAGANNGTATVTTIHTDFLGSPVAETNASGTVTRVERYTPYGEPADMQLDVGPGFTGHATDVATNLTYMQQRYYDADIGRFISPDPVGPEEDFVNHFNRYNYALNNPTRYTDPDGRAVETPWDVVSFGLGVKNLASNVREGNWGSAAVDTVGVLMDGAAILAPGVPGGVSAGISAIRVMDKVVDMGKFLKNSDFGKSIATSLTKTSRQVDGQSIYRVTENNGILKRGDQIYLDGKHKDHFEVFDKNGRPKAVLNMDGSINKGKTAKAIEEGRRLPKK